MATGYMALNITTMKDKAKLRDASRVRTTQEKAAPPKRRQHQVPSSFQRHLLRVKRLHYWKNWPHLSGLLKITLRCISVNFLVLAALVVIQENALLGENTQYRVLGHREPD